MIDVSCMAITENSVYKACCSTSCYSFMVYDHREVSMLLLGGARPVTLFAAEDFGSVDTKAR